MTKFKPVIDYSTISPEEALLLKSWAELNQDSDLDYETVRVRDTLLKISINYVKVPEKVYYFGCAKPYSSDGHQFYIRPWYSDYESRKWIPWKLGELDGGLAPVLNPHVKDNYRRQECPQGVTSVTIKDNWTALSFWDRTGDQRGASNSCFLIDSIVSFEEGIELARQQWTQLFERFEKAGLELKEYESTI